MMVLDVILDGINCALACERGVGESVVVRYRDGLVTMGGRYIHISDVGDRVWAWVYITIDGVLVFTVKSFDSEYRDLDFSGDINCVDVGVFVDHVVSSVLFVFGVCG